MAPASKAQQKALHKYVKNNYDHIELTVPKGKKDRIKSAADSLRYTGQQRYIF